MKTEKVTVTLKYNKAKKRYSVSIDKVSAWLGTATPQQVMWYSKNADLKVDFDKNGSPFAKSHFSGAKRTQDCVTGKPGTTDKKAYGYTLTITPNPRIQNGSVGTMTDITFDPQVIVTPDGPPGEGGRKAAKKKATKKKAGKKRARRGR